MKTTVSSQAQSVLPAASRRQDRIEAGQEVDVEREIGASGDSPSAVRLPRAGIAEFAHFGNSRETAKRSDQSGANSGFSTL